jgi:hypothetical protein
MKPEDRARTILFYLATNEVAGTPTIIHHQLKLYRDADWSTDTTKRRLRDFHEHGLVTYHPDVGKGYYEISEEGRNAIQHGISDDELTDIIGTAGYSWTD